jgi:hypothetical protein
MSAGMAALVKSAREWDGRLLFVLAEAGRSLRRRNGKFRLMGG